MYKFILMSTLIAYCMASYGGAHGSYGHGIPAAVYRRHTVHYKHYSLPSRPIKPKTVIIGSRPIPLNFLFKTVSSPIKYQQQHHGSSGQHIESHSEDKPDRLRHTVRKPIIQEVHEIISPYRRKTQKIRPAIEDIRTIVARGNDRDNSGAYSNGYGGRYGGRYGGEYGGGYGSDHEDGYGSGFGEGFNRGFDSKIGDGFSFGYSVGHSVGHSGGYGRDEDGQYPN